MKVILDNGHGIDTKGKRSPAYSGIVLHEWEFNRDIVNRIIRILYENGFTQVIVLVPECADISLKERVSRVNAIAGKKVLFSIHANAGGGTGLEVFTSVGETQSDVYATVLIEELAAKFPNQKLRLDFTDSDPDKEANFYILKYTNCPAVLSENFFMDRQSDCELIMSYEGRERIAEAHANAILKIAKY